MRTFAELSAKRLNGKPESPSLCAMRNGTMSQLTRVNVLFSEDEAERFNAYCSRHGFKKSTLIARLVRDHLDREDRKQSRKQSSEAGRKEPAAKIRGAHTS